MAMRLDVTTVVITKLRALLPGDQTTDLSTYVQSVVATAASSARKDITTRVWLDLPKT
jgi:hypothetical protein